MTQFSTESRNTFLRYFQDLLQDMEECDDMELSGSLRLGEKKVRIPEPSLPLRLMLGTEEGYSLTLDPEIVIGADGHFQRSGDYLLFDPDSFFSTISGFLRLSAGESLTLGREDPLQRRLLAYPSSVADKHLRLKLTENGLALKNKSPKRGACVMPLTKKVLLDRMLRWRKGKLEALASILKDPIEEPSRSTALDLLERVTQVMEREAYRLSTRDGRPGSVLRLPGRPAPIFVGDLHASIDNLLVLLTQNAFLDALRDGSGVLILVGDAVHPDTPGHEAEMDMSMLLMDLIFRLKLQFPERVFYLRGNHDSFADDISKGGVPQGVLWEQALYDRRGAHYRNAMQRLYDALPYIAVSPHYVACHAGAPTMKASRADLINAHRKPKLQHQLTHIRLRKSNSPSGYGPGDVRRLCKRLGVAPDTPFIVGHTPLSSDGTLWLNAGGIQHHHVLFGANPQTIGVITRSGGHLLPLTYPVEPLLPVINRLIRTGRLTA
ncbi:metallophosphoesterase [Thiohalocapsa marina]|uniref:Metallophosphoesterase n=1 Tax=Thiohalocapsa marina TaxID=424902 RepID=A0A5M8FMI3_9GAMM|nr:metallophosphoesterase [Thiohalocapsa marina]KAA6183665.1 metallophosphoesterase [Thiohalocapsa marina]